VYLGGTARDRRESAHGPQAGRTLMPSIGAETRGPAAAEGIMGAVVRALQWGLDRMLSVGYGVVYDAIFERFQPYRDLQADVLELVEKGAPHGLYVHPEPLTLLHEAWRVLKPGGHAVFVNPTRRVGPWSTFREIKHRDGLRGALASLLWLVPNSIFEVARKRIGPHYWDENQF